MIFVAFTEVGGRTEIFAGASTEIIAKDDMISSRLDVYNGYHLISEPEVRRLKSAEVVDAAINAVERSGRSFYVGMV